jgi:4-hydroxy-2-oxoheptanedioate aldolase
MTIVQPTLKSRINKGEITHGCWLSLSDLNTTEVMAQAGFDWLLLDLEHGTAHESHIVSQLMILDSCQLPGIVRVEGPVAARLGHAMDAGASGVMCPRINTAEEARRVIEGIHYPPLGKRGIFGLSRAAHYGKDFKGYIQQNTAEAIGIVQIETEEALQHLDAIAAIPGVDILFIGPHDLSMDLGIYTQFDHPRYLDAVQATVTACQKAGKQTGILVFNETEYRRYVDLGIRFIGYGSEVYFLKTAAQHQTKELNQWRKEYPV